jgi:hypothetical protein
MRKPILALALLVAIAALGGCGGKATSFVSVDWPPSGSAADFDTLVAPSATGYVRPTNAISNVSLLTTIEVAGIRSAFALFEDGLHALDAGTVTVRAHAPVGAASVFKTLDRLQLSVSGTIEYLYTSLVSNPLGLNLTFDGVEHHVFTASGSTSVPAFTDSVRSVATLFVGNPVGGSTHARSSDLEITWVNGSADTTVYVVAAVVSQVDSSKVAMADMVRDAGEYTTVPASRLALLPAGAARVSVARWRVVYHSEGARLVGLASESLVLRNITLN